jgi:hypothetical protein
MWILLKEKKYWFPFNIESNHPNITEILLERTEILNWKTLRHYHIGTQSHADIDDVLSKVPTENHLTHFKYLKMQFPLQVAKIG